MTTSRAVNRLLILDTSCFLVTSHPVDLTGQPTNFPIFVGHSQKQFTQPHGRKATQGDFHLTTYSHSHSLFSLFAYRGQRKGFCDLKVTRMMSEPDFRICLAGENEGVALAFSKVLNPQLLQWSCSVASRSDCGCIGQLPGGMFMCL